MVLSSRCRPGTGSESAVYFRGGLEALTLMLSFNIARNSFKTYIYPSNLSNTLKLLKKLSNIYE
ncbi:hypothetical protein GCM10008025_29900 [Ornithinibacillus halotolerans]|uniref:Uncharacterized protein n=1 Tax=Ornithinibacillus halotolerans TaxID=1274357 RepID=A0A916S7P7_9BACI|nr:hypothetical protein GCM10008025_29900 [Ornithinibacillus halotolerans]